MTSNNQNLKPDHTAIRVALWRALHVQLDQKPHVFTDEIGLKLVGENDWLNRQDMNSAFSRGMRASIVGRARFIEDLLENRVELGTTQYVILGAGLDTFAQRRPELACRLQVFEVDQLATQIWKQKRLADLGFSIPNWLHFVPVDFEAGQSWWEKLIESGFDIEKKTVVVSTGVSMYLTKETNLKTFKQIAKMGQGSTFATTFMLALDLLEPQERSAMEFVMKKTQEANTPFLSLFSPSEILTMAKEAGFKKAEYVSGKDLYEYYFAKRADGLKAGNAEAFLVAET